MHILNKLKRQAMAGNTRVTTTMDIHINKELKTGVDQGSNKILD